MGMVVHVNNPELQAKIDQWVMETGRPADELVEDAMASYFAELAQVRQDARQPLMTTSKHLELGKTVRLTDASKHHRS
jgi:hypothetical protein